MKHLKRHRILYKVLRVLLIPLIRCLLGFDYKVYKDRKGPYIVLANHISQWDPLPIGLSFPQQMYYVASEHIFRWGIVSKIITFLVAPIARAKSTTDTKTVKEVLKALRAGANVCIFAEGNMTFNGETGEFADSIGKLVKVSGAGLVTYRFEGGYFMDPRWAKKRRKGHYTGSPVRYYSPEELKAISADELNRRILRDIYINDFEWQEKHQIPFRGKDLAENIGLALYYCPQCGQIGTLKGSGDYIRCTCGLNYRYTPYGFIEGTTSKALFTTVLDWDKWQKRKLEEHVLEHLHSNGDHPLLSDPNQTLIGIERARKGEKLLTGTLEFYTDRLLIRTENGEERSFSFEKMLDLAVHGRSVLVFTMKDQNKTTSYEVHTVFPRSALKYMDLYHLLSKKPQ